MDVELANLSTGMSTRRLTEDAERSFSQKQRSKPKGSRGGQKSKEILTQNSNQY